MLSRNLPCGEGSNKNETTFRKKFSIYSRFSIWFSINYVELYCIRLDILIGGILSNDQKIEQVCRELDVIFDDMRTLVYEVSRHTLKVDAKFNDKRSLPSLAQTLGVMVSQLNALRIDLVKIREAEQLEEA